MLKNDGIPSQEELAPITPTPARFEKGPVALIECFQDIPCDPCVGACPKHAIIMKDGITDKPHLMPDLCSGCGLCVAKCPGLAIFVLDMAYSPRYAKLSLPYELIPVPKVGDVVNGLDRTGKAVCEVKVLKVITGKQFDHTHVVTIELPKSQAMNVRGIKVSPKGKGK
ncbi:MAG: 4Fe-4S binding protein [Candidatus Riflebacteria bacterium]|nr:4Fe-4S binding protein [Candidatus Riflebacteria bacterium]